MGTYYTLGVVEEFEATSKNKILSETEWQKLLNERLDLSLFNITLEEKTISGALKENIFEENIEHFYEKLKEMANSEDINYYFESQGNKITNYQQDVTSIKLKAKEDTFVVCHMKFLLLFIEGKVLTEQFIEEPKLMNWLFRHCDLGNPLAGCIISSITS